jgi:competence protein ComEA
MMSKIWFLAAGLWCLGGAAAAQDEDRALLERKCTKCHALAITTRQRNDKERWSFIVDNMVTRGAELTDDEIEKLIDYLAKTLGPKVNVNKASAENLVKALELPKAVAAAIVEYREKNGSFKDLESLKKVAAVDAKEIDNRKDRIEF